MHGVIAGSPSDTVFGSYPTPGSAAWTYNGQPILPRTQIPVQKINGPVFLDCGTNDHVWPSCAFARAIQTRLAGVHDPHRHVLYQYTGAGHFVATLVPYEPASPAYNRSHLTEEGTGPLADDSALANLWPHLLAFLAHPASASGTITTNATTPAD